jgi:uncharacterized membrane protein
MVDQKETDEETSEIIPKRKTSRNLVIALSIVSIISFTSIVLESIFYINISEYIDTLWLMVLGIGLIFETSIGELKLIKKDGLNSEYLGKITMIVVGSLSVIAGALSLPQVNIQNPSFLAVKGIISLLAIVFIILQTWIAKHEE